jgi:hypothetical protein
MTLAGLQEGCAEDLRGGNITAMPQGIGISREDVKMGIGGKQLALGLQTFRSSAQAECRRCLQAMPGSHGGHVADELRHRRLFALAHLHGFCGRQRLPISDPKDLLAARAAAAPQALGARLPQRDIEMGFVPENGIGL